MYRIIKKLFPKGKSILLGFLLLWSIITWIINPPFYKTQNIKIIQIEENYRKSGFNTEHSRNIHYEYTLENQELVNGKFLSYNHPFVKVGKYIKYNVLTSYTYGGKLDLFSTTSFFIFLLFWSYFLLVFIFKIVVSFVSGTKISESDASATVFGILVLLLMMWKFI